MKESKLLKWSSFSDRVISLAVVITLLFLALKTMQNSDAINAQVNASRAESSAAIFEMTNMWLETVIEHPGIMRDLHSTKSLKSTEESRLIAWMRSMWGVREFIWRQHRDGVVDQATFESAMDQRWFFETLRGREWWDATAIGTFDPEFVDLINNQYRDK